MFRNFILLLCLMAISACFAETKKSPIKNLDTCEPPSSFNPIFSKIALDGTFVFFEKKLQYFYNILDNDWSCEKPKLNVVNFFSTNSTEVLYKTIKKNDVYKINEIQIKKDDMFGFKSFVI